MRIFYLTELLSPYRVEWMNLLCRGNTVDAFYMHAEEATRTDAWLHAVQPQFHTCQVEKTAGGRLASRAFLKRTEHGGYDVFVVDGYSSPVKLQVIRRLLKRRKRVFINIDGIDVWSRGGRAEWIKAAVKRRVFRSGACFLCGSHLAADYLVQNGADSQRVFVHTFTSLHRSDILTPDQKDALQAEAKRQLGVGSGKVVLAAGRFIPLKRYEVLIRAWQGMPEDCRLYLIGGGPLRDDYEQLAASLGVTNVTLMDFMPPEQLRTYFYAADLFVHPSETETWGLVINEAMAAGCPVIATNRCVAGVELIRDGKEGFLTEVGDVDALHESMRQILGDDALRGGMRRHALERIRPYTYENLAETHLQIFAAAKAPRR